MVIFRENTEDIYAGIEYQTGTEDNEKLKNFLIDELDVDQIRFPDTSSLGIKRVSEEGTKRLVRSAIDYAIETGRSEEHTSELQSRFDLVCRLLLEKKKKYYI